MPNLRVLAGSAVAVLLVAGAIFPLLRKRAVNSANAAPPPTVPTVQAALVENRSVARTLRLTGTLKSLTTASLSPKQGGRVLSVPVRVGDRVKRGQLLVQLDDSDMRRQAEQAQAGARVALASLAKAREGLRLKRVEVNRRVTAAQRGVEQARLNVERAQAGIRVQKNASNADVDRALSGLEAAKAALAQARRGARPEQKRQVEIQVQSAERGVADARKSMDDIEYLVGKGGLPRVKLDEARRGYERATDGLAQARAQLDLLNAGAGAEEIRAAEAQVKQAEAGVAAAKAGANRDEVSQAEIAAANSQLGQAEDGLKVALATRDEIRVSEQDVAAAQAGVDQSAAAARLATQQLESARLTSPVDGTVTGVTVDPGELAGPGMPAVTVTGTNGVYLEAVVPSRQLSQLRLGLPVTVTLDAVPGREVRGSVRSIGQTAGPDGRSFPVEIDLDGATTGLTVGANARAEVQVEQFSGALSVPAEALRTADGQNRIWVVRDGAVAELSVQIPYQDEERAVVTGALRAGEPVILNPPPGLRPGEAVAFDLAKDGSR